MPKYLIPAGTYCSRAPNDDQTPYKAHRTTEDIEAEVVDDNGDRLMLFDGDWMMLVKIKKLQQQVRGT